MKIKGLCIAIFFMATSLAYSSAAPPLVVHLDLNGTIHPITAEYVKKGIDYAVAAHARLIVLQLQTPGGLGESMRTIISSILSSPVPVAVFVGPSGSRAASAGFYITIASDVAVMA